MIAKHILVAYASGTGSTAEVAEAIGDVIATADVSVSVKAAREVTDISPYSAIVLGSSIRIGRWLPDAVDFVAAFRETMSKIPIAYFTTCLTMARNDENSRRTVLAYMEPVRQLAPDIQPVGLGLFAGSLSPSMQAILPGDTGPYGDFRDWEAIRGWAAEILPALLENEVKVAAPIVLGGAMLSFTDMSGLDLQQMDLYQAKLQEATLREANLHGADLRQTDMTRADLRRANLEDAGLSWADMNMADLRDANLSKANLMGVNLQEADLRHADLSYAILNGANLNRASLLGADLAQADLNWADLSRANLSKANLSNANLSWADLQHANLVDANLRNAVYNLHTKWPEGFSAMDAGCILAGKAQ